MNLNSIEHKLTIPEIASVFALKKVNELNTERSNLSNEFTLLMADYEGKIAQKVKEIFRNSKYFEALKLIFGDDEPYIYFQYSVSEEYKDLIKIDKYPMDYFNKISGEGCYSLFIKLENYKGEIFYLELEEKLETIGMGAAEIQARQQKINELDSEIKKDWEKVYTTHFIASKMVDAGFNENVSIPELPEIQLNNLLS